MTRRVDELVKQLNSPDPNQRALALAELVHEAGSAVPVLTEALASPDVRLRTQAAQALAEIADPASADAFFQALSDSDEAVRARAAQGLARIKDQRAIKALVQTINDFPDVLHAPYTLSTYLLIEAGPDALPAVAPLLMSSDPLTRERAFLVVRTIVSELPEVANWEQLWESLGRYDPNGAAYERDHAAVQWLTWVDERRGRPPQ